MSDERNDVGCFGTIFVIVIWSAITVFVISHWKDGRCDVGLRAVHTISDSLHVMRTDRYCRPSGLP